LQLTAPLSKPKINQLQIQTTPYSFPAPSLNQPITFTDKSQVICMDQWMDNNAMSLFFSDNFMKLMVTNKSLFRQNSEIHNFNTSNNSNFSQVTTHLTILHKSPAYAGVKIYNHLPPDIKDLACDMKSFKKSVEKCFACPFLLYCG
jgi:hypothetical protein